MPKKHEVVYYTSPANQNPVKNFIEALSPNPKSKVFRIFQLFEEYGLQSIIPHTKKLTGTLLWEIKVLGKDNIRILYVTWQKENILVLHAFLKKKQKTPMRDINIAMNRFNEVNSSIDNY